MNVSLAQPAPVDAVGADRPPIFLIGAERSGTTMLRLMLDHHPQVSFDGEFEYAVDFMTDGGGWPDAGAYARWLATQRRFQRLGLRVDPSMDYPHLVRDFLRQQHAGHEHLVHGATVHRYFARVLRVWPDARLIYLLRDGRDVARSRIGMGWAGNIYCGVDDWIAREREWERLRDTLPADRYIEVRFEDVIGDSDAELTRICRFMGVEFDRAMYSYAVQSTYELPDPKLVYQWRKKLTERELREAESRIAEQLAKRNYPLSGHPALRVGTLRRWWLRMHDRLGRVGFRIRRYGPMLWAANAVISRIGTGAMRQRMRLRTNAIDEQHVR